MVDHYYDPSDELGLAWDDPDVAIDWGIAEPVLSGRDQSNPRRAEIPSDRVPQIGHVADPA
jgi:dTDP-4-dehydrorhamnose 3,5-epimerase